MEKKKIIIYGTKNCPYCHIAKDFIEENGFEVEYIDVGVDKEKAEEMVKLSGQTGVPVIVIDGEVIIGFNRDMIEKLLGI